MKFAYSALLAAGSVPRSGTTVPKRGLPSAPLFLYVEIALRVRRSYVASKGDAARKNACATKQNGRGSGGRQTDGGGGRRDPTRLDRRYGTPNGSEKPPEGASKPVAWRSRRLGGGEQNGRRSRERHRALG